MKRFYSSLCLLLLFASNTISAGDNEGQILFVNSFEGNGNVPQFVPVPDQSGVVERELLVDIDTSEPANQNGVIFSLIDAPAGMNINQRSGVIQWTPTSAQLGTDSVTVQVEDLEGLSNSLIFDVEIIDNSASPLIEFIADQTTTADQRYQFQVSASDPDPGESLLYALDQAPVGMLIDAITGLIEWTPGINEIGSYEIIARVTDSSGQSDLASYTLTVVDQNEAPILELIADRGAAPDVLAEVQANAIDPDGGPVRYSLPVRPTGMAINPDTGLIRWTPTLQQLGPHSVTVVVRDEFGTSDSTDFEIFVDLNRAPVAVNDSGYRVERGDTLMIPAAGILENDSDPNGDVLSSLLDSGPTRGSLQLNNDGSFEYTPDNPVGTIGLSKKWEVIDANGGQGWQPLIGNIDDDPAAEIIVGDGSGCCETRVEAFDGATGQSEWVRSFTTRDVAFQGKPVLADIDQDGQPEILLIGGDPDASPTNYIRLYALEHDGNLKWISQAMQQRGVPPTFTADVAVANPRGTIFNSAITVADLNADGSPEILVASRGGFGLYHVWDNNGNLADWSVLSEGTLGNDGTRINVVDLDLDGAPEILLGNGAFTLNGEELWARNDGSLNSNSVFYNFPLIANLDDDPYPELVRRRSGNAFSGPANDVIAWNHDGTDLWEFEVGSTGGVNTAPITIADVNNDGQAEVLVPANSGQDRLDVLNGQDGTVLWSVNVPTRNSGATVFDLDRDGFNEVVFIDNNSDLWVWDGRDGSEKLFFEDLTEFVTRPPEENVPVFADVDADGAAELVIQIGFSFGFTEKLIVWESPTDDWGPMGSIWNEQRYYVTNINEDLTVPTRPRPHWLQPGLNQAMVNERLPEARTEDQDQFSYRASDGQLQSNVATVDITILPPNTPPRILSVPRTLASPGFEYVYRALAVDADVGENLTWSVAEGPTGLTVDSQGTVRWTPTVGDLGPNPVVLEVTDTVGISGFQNFIIEVQDPIAVPNLAGLSEAEAIDVLAAAGLVVDPLRPVFSDAIPTGQVVTQDPSAGNLVAAGASVLVEVSLGPVPLRVPDLIALTLDDATAEILAEGFSIGSIEFVNDDVQPSTTVLIQDPAPRFSAAPGTAIDLSVSGGPRAVIEITPTIIPAGSSAEVAVTVRDRDGTILNPQPAVILNLEMAPGDIVGTPPILSGTTISTADDSQGQFSVTASFSAPDSETISSPAVIAQTISDGEGANIFSEFAEQLDQYETLIADLITAVNTADGASVIAIDAALATLLDEIDTLRLNGLSPIAPEGGVPPTPEQAIQFGFTPGPDDAAYLDAALDLFAVLEQSEQVVREGVAPDPVINALNQELADVVSAASELNPEVYGVLTASEVLIALLGTRVPRTLVADIRAVRQSLRDDGLLTENGRFGGARFTLPGVMTASQIRTNLIKDLYVPYLGDVAIAMGAVVAADALQAYGNAGSLSGVITGGSLSIHVFDIDNSVIEGIGFDTLLPEGNAVLMIGPELVDRAIDVINQQLPNAQDLKDLNKIRDAVISAIESAEAFNRAFKEANSSPSQVLRGCLLDNSPDCRQLIYANGFTSVYKTDNGFSLAAPVLIVVQNLAGGGFAVTLANFVPTREE